MSLVSSPLRRGVSILEVVVVIAIIAVGLALLIPAVQRTRESANCAQCANNLHQLAIAVHSYQDAERRFPYNQFGGAFGAGGDSHAWSWLARLLPYQEQANLYAEGQIPKRTLIQSGVIDRQIRMLICPSDDSGAGPRLDAGNLKNVPVGKTNYKGVSGANWGDDWDGIGPNIVTDWRNVGTNGSFDGHSDGDGIFFRLDYKRCLHLTQIGDGAANTFMIGEDVPALTHWCSWPYANNANGTCAIAPNVKRPDDTYYPPGNWENNESFRSRHPGGLQFAFADGAVRFVSDSIELKVYRALGTINGGEVASLP